MKYYVLNICNCRILLCLFLSSLSLHVHSADDGVVFDPDGLFISTTGHATLSSYALEDHDVSYSDILKLDGSSLFIKGADTTNGIMGTVGAGGSIDLKAYVYDQDHNKYLIYHARLEENSSDAYSTGTPQTVNIKIHRSDTSAHHAVAGTDVKQLFQSVSDTYQITKEDLDQLSRTSIGHSMKSVGSRERRGFWRRLGIWVAGAAAGALVGVATVVTVGTGGLAAPILVGAAAVAGSVVALGAEAISEQPKVAYSSQNHHSADLDSGSTTEVRPVPQIGSTEKVDYNELEKNHKVLPIGAYPTQVVLEINNARYIDAKIPGIPRLTPALFQAWNLYSPQQVKEGIARGLWLDTPGVLDEDDHEVDHPRNANSSSITATDLADVDVAIAKLVINPRSNTADAAYTYNINNRSGPANPPELKMGDHIALEVAFPLKDGHPFDENNPDHYPKITNFPYTWMALFSGEVLYQCEPSIQPGEWRPWLGYDSQVHGTVMRNYPDNFQRKFYDWHVDQSNNGYVIFRWTAKLSRRMSSDKHLYSSVHDWPKKKSQPVSQRNNQKEGLNMELLRAWKDHTQGTDQEPDFASYEGNRVLPGLDPDEFLYLRNSDGHTTDIITLDGEPWKQVPADEAANPLNDIVTAYKRNRMWHVDNIDYRSVYGTDYNSRNYEIQDLGTSVSTPDGTGTGNNTAIGRIGIHLPDIAVVNHNTSEINIDISVIAPLETDKGFYGNIAGPGHPAIWEKGLMYQISGLREGEADNYAVSFIHEDSLGRRKYLNYFSSQMPSHIKNKISENGEWYVAVPVFLGYGYYSVNLWYNNTDYTDSWTRIGGKELLDISLRFLSVPGSGAGSGYPGVNLRESPGDGAHIYLDEFLDRRHGDYSTSKFNRYAKTHVRTYVFHKGDSATFEVFDSDPHTFVHRGTEWYLSARTQAKRIKVVDLDDKIRYFVDPIRANGRVSEDHTVDGTGSKFTHHWNTPGYYQLKVVYNNSSSVSHRIVVLGTADRQNGIKADIDDQALTSQQIRWLENSGVSFGSTNWRLFSVENVDSKYRYIDGPRMHTDNQVNRFHPGLDYADGYKWRIGPSSVDYNPGGSHGPTGLAGVIEGFKDGVGWLPNAFVRHTSEKNSNGEPMPDDIANGSVSVSQFSNLSSDQETRINSLFNGVPEPWQVRLPWISFVTDPDPYGTSDVYSYRTRTNIKVLYDMEAFFHNDSGAFSGNPTDPVGGDYSYENLVNLGIYLHLMSDDTKLKREFYRNLATGRMIIYPDQNADLEVSNAKSTGTTIAELDYAGSN